MKFKLLFALFLLFAFGGIAHADWLRVPIKGDGSRANPFSPVVPPGVTTWTGNTVKGFFIIFVPTDTSRVALGAESARLSAEEASKELGAAKIAPGHLQRQPDTASVKSSLLETWRKVTRPFKAAIAWASSANDNFNRADSTDLGASWDTYATINNLQIVGNRVRPGAAGGSDTFESYNAASFSPHQSVQVTWANIGGTASIYAGPMLRMAAPNTLTGYFCVTTFNEASTKTQIAKVVAGSYTVLATENATTWTTGDIMRCDISGVDPGNIIMRRNGATLLTASDSDIDSGRPGLANWISSGGTLSDAELDDWSAGDILMRRRSAVIFLD